MTESTQFDVLLTQLGTGRWNLIHFIGAAVWYMLIPPQAFSVVFLVPSLNHTCLPSALHNVSQIAGDSCTYERWSEEGGVVEETCTNWEYDDTYYTNTITSEFGLVCSQGYLRATYQSLYMFAAIFGSMVSGYAADKYGRKMVTTVSQSLYAITCIGIALCNNLTLILALRFILGALGTPTFYMLGMEVCQVKHRSIVGVMMGLPWAVGMMLTGAVAYLIREWRYFQLACSIPTLLVFPILYLINESPRWLIVTGQHKEALRVLRRAARLNKATLPPDHVLTSMMADIQSETENQKKDIEMKAAVVSSSSEPKKSRWSLSCPTLLKTGKIRLVTFCLSVNLFILSLVYCGLSLSGSTYSSDPFLYIIISGLMEVPGYTITSPIISRWGRKNPTILGFVVCGGVILSLAFVPSSLSWLVMTFAMVGKLAITSSFMIVFVYQAELLPTEVRLQGLAVTMIAGQIAGTIAPYIAEYLGPMIPWLPSVIFGVSSFVASLAILPLPETLGRNLPDTVADLEQLWRKGRRRKAINGTADSDDSEDSQLKKLTA